MRWPRRTTVVAVWLVLAAAVGGCSLVDEPDAAAWDSQAEQALTDAVSEVATARLALKSAADERVWSPYTEVLVADAEKGIAKVADDLGKVQVPREREQQADDVTALIDKAVDAVRDARSLAVQGRYDDPAALADLDRLATDLEHAAGQR